MGANFLTADERGWTQIPEQSMEGKCMVLGGVRWREVPGLVSKKVEHKQRKPVKRISGPLHVWHHAPDASQVYVVPFRSGSGRHRIWLFAFVRVSDVSGRRGDDLVRSLSSASCEGG